MKYLNRFLSRNSQESTDRHRQNRQNYRSDLQVEGFVGFVGNQSKTFQNIALPQCDQSGTDTPSPCFYPRSAYNPELAYEYAIHCPDGSQVSETLLYYVDKAVTGDKRC